MRTAQELLSLIQRIGITPNIRKKLIHKCIRYEGDQVIIPSNAIKVMKYNRPFINSEGVVQLAKYTVMAWIDVDKDKVCYAEYNPNLKHTHNGETISNYVLEKDLSQSK